VQTLLTRANSYSCQCECGLADRLSMALTVSALTSPQSTCFPKTCIVSVHSGKEAPLQQCWLAFGHSLLQGNDAPQGARGKSYYGNWSCSVVYCFRRLKDVDSNKRNWEEEC